MNNRITVINTTNIKNLLVFLLILLFSIHISSAQIQSTISIDDYAMIQWAVDNASAGDAITVESGTAAENSVGSMVYDETMFSGKKQVSEYMASAQEESTDASYIIVHALNPEGIEIASIEGMNTHCVEIYDGDTLIGYGAHDNETHNKPIAISPGGHTVKAVFNGMTESKNINIVGGNTQQLFFIFSRTEVIYNPQFCYDGNLSASLTWEGGWMGKDVVDYNNNLLLFLVYIRPQTYHGGSASGTVSYSLTPTNFTLTATAYMNSTTISQIDSGAHHATVNDPIFGTSIVLPINLPPTSEYDNWFVQQKRTGIYPRVFFRDQSSATLISSNSGVYLHTLPANITYTEGTFYPAHQPDGLLQILGYDSGSYSLSKSGTLEYLNISSVPYDKLGTGITCPEVQIPVASFTFSPEYPVEGEEITFDASSSYDPDGEIVSYNWTFGDGNGTEGEVVTYTYSKAGNYTSTLTVTDNDGLQDTTELSFWVGRPVLLVHGIYSRSGMWDTSMFGDEFIVETIDLTPNNGDIPDLAAKLKDKIQSMKEKYGVEEVDIVAHSMGGLVSRWYIQKLGGRDVNKLIMIGTPNHGSEWGALRIVGDYLGGDIKVGGPAASQMLPHSSFLRNLNQNDKCAAIFGPDKDKIDCIDGTAEYFVLAGNNLPTPSHIHIKILGVDFIKSCVARGDFVVPYNSAKLDNVYIDSISPCHICKQGKNKAVINKVKDILRGGSSTQNKNLASSLYYSPSSKLEEEQEASDALSSIEVVNDVIYPTEVKIYNISLDNAVTGAYFSIGWGDGILDLTLHSPNGTVINSSFANMSQNITYFEGEVYKYYHIKAPEIGNWSIDISAVNVSDTGTKFTFTTFLESDLFVGVNTSKNIFDPGEEINISAYVGSNESAFTGALVVAKISKPDNTTENITLYDDGLHNDNQTNDGIYANTYTNTSSWGTYHITVSATGTLDGEEFERQAFTTVWVEQYPDLTLNASDISFSNDAPLVGENITINATIHNIGEANATNATILFYGGDPMKGTTIGEDVVNVSVNATANASVSWIAKAGVHEIYVLISPYNEFLEKNYTNNRANKSIKVKIPPNITSWSNNKSNDLSLDITVNISEDVNFNATANQTITTWNWYDDGTDKSHNYDNITLNWSSSGLKTVIVNATNPTGTSYPVQWNVTVSPASGDFSGDGTTDAWDITYLARSIAGIPDYETLSSGDVSGDGVVDAWDCTYLARAIAGVPGYSV